MLSCWHDLLFFCLLLSYLLLPSMGWLCAVGVFGLIVFSLSPGLAQRTPMNNNNNNSSSMVHVMAIKQILSEYCGTYCVGELYVALWDVPLNLNILIKFLKKNLCATR